MIISHLFTGSAVQPDVESLETLLVQLKGAAKDEAFAALDKEYPKKRREEFKREMVRAIHDGEVWLAEYVQSMLIPRVIKTILPRRDLALFPVLRVNYSCDMCEPTTYRREYERDSYVTERQVFSDLRKYRLMSEFYEACLRHRKQRELSVSMSFDAPLHEQEYKLYSIRAGVKSGEALMMKLINRLEDGGGPIWDLYRAKAVTMSPHDDLCERLGWHDYSLIILKDVYEDIMHNMDNTWRDVWNAEIAGKVIRDACPETEDEKNALMKNVIEKEWVVPCGDKGLFDYDRITADPHEEKYLAEKIFDAYHVPIEIHLTCFNFERKHYQGSLRHEEYEKRRSMKALIDWEDYQRGIFKFFIETGLFDRTPGLR